MDDSLFFAVPLNSYGETACSPDLSGQNEPGLRIAAPRQIDLALHEVFPLCGTLRLQAGFIAELGDDPIEAIVIVVVDKERDIPLSFKLKPPDKEPPEDKDGTHKPPNPDDFDEDDLRENYFNVDLLTFSSDLRQHLRPGRFVVHAMLSTLKSNMVEIEVTDSSKVQK